MDGEYTCLQASLHTRKPFSRQHLRLDTPLPSHRTIFLRLYLAPDPTDENNNVILRSGLYSDCLPDGLWDIMAGDPTFTSQPVILPSSKTLKIADLYLISWIYNDESNTTSTTYNLPDEILEVHASKRMNGSFKMQLVNLYSRKYRP
jgi:hypothetical protein